MRDEMSRVGRCNGIALLLGLFLIVPGIFPAWNAVAEMSAAESRSALKPGLDAGTLETIDMTRVKGKERITVIATEISSFKVEDETANAILLKLENMQMPGILRRPFSNDSLKNVRQVAAEQKIVSGVPWVHVLIDLNQPVPYSVRREGRNLVVDFNVAGLGGQIAAAEERMRPGENTTPSIPESLLGEKVSREAGPKKASPAEDSTAFKYTGQKISLDFQDADIRAVLRLLAETGGVSIVAGPDVKGSVSVHMKGVPWDQALETILDIQGLAKKEMGDVISVMTLEKKKKDEETRKAAEKDLIEAEANRKMREQQLMAEKGRLRQISIEAKIVEASDGFIRDLGVTWGGSYNSRRFQTAAGTNTSTTEGQTNPVSYPYPSGIGIPGSQAAVNLPGAIAGTPTLGFLLGGSQFVLEAQIAALESTSAGKIISSPKVVTMDGVKATIKQGSQIPYTTYEASGGTSYPKVDFKDALLKLEVTPTITPDGRISMQIVATNDRGDYSKQNLSTGNVPIIKNEVDSKVVVEDATTVVIGGVSITSDDRSVSGVPWLSRIPVLGWLFKSESIDKTRKQLLIFVTPKIMPDKESAPIASVNKKG